MSIRGQILSRLTLAIAFLATASMKFIPVPKPSSVPRAALLVVAFIEFAVALALLARPRARWPALVGAGLLICFTAFLAFYGATFASDCRCFGPIRLATWQHVAVNGSLLALAGIAAGRNFVPSK